MRGEAVSARAELAPATNIHTHTQRQESQEERSRDHILAAGSFSRSAHASVQCNSKMRDLISGRRREGRLRENWLRCTYARTMPLCEQATRGASR
jgi:hypothetical protein